MKRLKLRLYNVPEIISSYKADPELKPALFAVSNNNAVLINIKNHKVTIYVALETIICTERFLALLAKPGVNYSHVLVLPTAIMRWEAILFCMFLASGYDKISQVLLLKRSDDKLELTKVVELLKVYNYGTGVDRHCIPNV